MPLHRTALHRRGQRSLTVRACGPILRGTRRRGPSDLRKLRHPNEAGRKACLVCGARPAASCPIRPTAILVGSDVMAIGALQAAACPPLRVPEDISIVGFDGISFSAL